MHFQMEKISQFRVATALPYIKELTYLLHGAESFLRSKLVCS